MKRLSLTVGIVGLFVAAYSQAFADGLIRDGVGAISVGRGGTNIAHSDNGAILLDNPAGLINVQGRGLFEFNIDTLVTDLDYRDNDPNNVEAEFRPTVTPQGAFIQKSADGNFAAGIGFYVPAGFGAEYEKVHPVFGNRTYRSFGMLAKLIPGIAYKVNERLSVGATLGVSYSRVKLDGPLNVQTGPLAGAPTLHDSDMDDFAISWSAGLQYKVSDATTIGVSYLSKSDFTLNGDVDVFIPPLPGLPGSIASNFDSKENFAWPRSLGFGIAHRIGCKHRVSADVIWYDWSDAFNGIRSKLTNPSNPAVPLILGPTLRDRFPLDWNDSISLRTGYEYFTDCGDVWRLGYVYHNRPVPDSTLNPYVDGSTEHSFSAGYSTDLNGWKLNLAYQFMLGFEEEIGVSQIVGGDFNNSEFRANAHWLAVSFMKPF